MTKRKTTQKPNAAVNSTPPKQAVEGVKVESNTIVTPKPKRANSKATAKPRGRPKKKVIIEQVYEVLEPKKVVVQLQGIVEPQDVKITMSPPAPVSKAVDTDSRTITYTSAGNAVPSKYEQFKAWLVFKLYYYTSYFRGY